jgi:hypothetical protein
MTPTVTPTVTPTITGTPLVDLTGSVQFQGRATPLAAGVPLHVTVTHLDTVTEYDLVTDTMGTFVVTLGAFEGDYDVRVKGAHTLSAFATLTLAIGGNTYDFGELPEGDANGDNFVTFDDYSLLFANVGMAVQPDSGADFNGDGFVLFDDYSLLFLNFGAEGS